MKPIPLSLPQLAGFPTHAQLEFEENGAADALAAVASNEKFPDRKLELGQLAIKFAGASDTLKTGLGDVSLSVDAEVKLGLAVVDTLADVGRTLQLAGGDDVALPLAEAEGRRFAVVSAGYVFSGSGKGTHPLGAIGKATFGVEGKRARTFAAVLPFRKEDKARDVLEKLVTAWRLPATVAAPADLPSGALVLSELDGTLQANLQGQLGYDFSWVRELEGGRLAGDIGLKIAAAASIELGISFAGRFLLCVQRPDEAATLRLRLQKLTKKGRSFAGNLTVGVKGELGAAPEDFDEFLAAVLGVHGKQVMHDLQALVKWTDPDTPLADMLAEFTRERALELVGDGTIAKYKEKQAAFAQLVQDWAALPGKTSSWLWSFLRVSDQTRQKAVAATLQAIAGGNASAVTAQVTSLLGSRLPVSQNVIDALSGLVESNVLELLESSRADDIRQVAATAGKLLDGGYLAELQKKIVGKLDLQQIVDATKWEQVDGWLKARLETFFGQTLGLEHLEPLRQTIAKLLAQRKTIYAAARDALTRNYEFSLAAKYERSTARGALLDATFDFAAANSNAAATFAEVLRTGNFDGLLLQPTVGVTLAQGLLSHAIERRTTLQFTLPKASGKVTEVTKSLAQLEVKSDGAALVGAYTLGATDEVKSAGRYASWVTVSLKLIASTGPGGQLRIDRSGDGSWAYSLRFILENGTVAKTAGLLEPIRAGYFAQAFPDGSNALTNWLTDLDRAVEDAIGTPTDDLGDLLVSFDVRAPLTVLRPWFEMAPGDTLAARQRRVSLALQRALRDHFWRVFGQDLSVFNSATTPKLAAMLTYASLRALNGLTLNYDQLAETEAPYWNTEDSRLLRAVTRLQDTANNMSLLLAGVRDRLYRSGLPGVAALYVTPKCDYYTDAAMPALGAPSGGFHALMVMEALVIAEAMKALARMDAFLHAAGAAQPQDALQALAEFGEAVTRGFHAQVKSLYLPRETGRALGLMLLSEASRALAKQPTSFEARLKLDVLMEKRSFAMPAFLDGENPPDNEIALTQPLVALN